MGNFVSQSLLFSHGETKQNLDGPGKYCVVPEKKHIEVKEEGSENSVFKL